MGREAREARDARVAATAEYERTVGPTLKFRERSECPKCGVPEQHLARLYCAGAPDPESQADDRKRWLQQGGCPVTSEHLHVGCPRCKFGWHELCADDDRNRMPAIEVVS